MTKEKHHWSRLEESGTLLGMRLLLLVYRLTGHWGFRLVLWPVMVYYYLTKKEARRASAEYLHRFRQHNPDNTLGALAGLRHFIAFGENTLDKFLVWTGRIQRQDVVFEHPANIAKLHQQHRGGVILVSHLGNAEICRALAYQVPNIKLTVLVHTSHAAKFNRLLNHIAPQCTIEILQVAELSPATAMTLARRVQSGGYVIIAGDRTPVTGLRTTSTVRFLGDTALMAQGPFILAGLLACQVWLMFCLKIGGRYHIYLEQFSSQMALPRTKRQETLDAQLQSYALRLEHYCKLAPLQWFNFFSFWGTPPQPASRSHQTSKQNASK